MTEIFTGSFTQQESIPEAGIDAAQLFPDDSPCLSGIDRSCRTELLDEGQALGTDVHSDDLVAQVVRELNGIVSEAARCTDDRDSTARRYVVLRELLDGAVGRKASAREGSLFVADAVR